MCVKWGKRREEDYGESRRDYWKSKRRSEKSPQGLSQKQSTDDGVGGTVRGGSRSTVSETKFKVTSLEQKELNIPGKLPHEQSHHHQSLKKEGEIESQ